MKSQRLTRLLDNEWRAQGNGLLIPFRQLARLAPLFAGRHAEKALAESQHGQVGHKNNKK